MLTRTGEVALDPLYFEALAEMTGHPAFIAGRDGYLIYANSALAAVYHLEKAGLVGRSVSSLQGFCKFPDSVISGAGQFDAVLPGADGVPQQFEVRLQPVGGEGQPMAFCAILTPKQVQEPSSAPAGVDALRVAIQEMHQGVIIWDSKGLLFGTNEKARELYARAGVDLVTGIARHDVVEFIVRSGFFGKSYIGMDRVIEAIMRVGEGDFLSAHSRTRMLADNKGGQWQLTSHPLPQGWLMTVYDDLETDADVQGQQTNLTSYYDGILQYMPDFIVHIGAENTIQFVNNSFADALGKNTDELIGKPSSVLLQDILGEPMEQMLQRATPENAIFSYEQRWEPSPGKYNWLRWSAHVLFHGREHAGVIASGRDITVEYRQQMNLRHQSEELEKKNRSLEQFAAVVSHDLKAPLRHVSIFADMIVEEAAKGNLEEVNTYGKQVRQSALRMDRVIKRLLEYSQIAYRIATPQHVNLADIVIQAIQNLESQIEEARAEVLLSKLPEFTGDPDLLRHLMQNLIANAVKYRRTGARPRIRIYATETGSVFNIFIEDNGIGIDPKYAGTIFTAFQRLHKDEKVYDGFGVGLALCRQIVESHQGTIELDTGYRTGARFIVRLPRHLKNQE
jgi:PAS domain S-box-containing protein